MLILGLLLVVISGAAAALLIAFNSGGAKETVSLFGWDIADVNHMQAFLAGIVLSLLFMLGLSMIMRAGRRGRENRARYKEARRDAKSAADERDELAEKLRREEQQAHQPTVAQPVQTQATGQHAAGQRMTGQRMTGQHVEYPTDARSAGAPEQRGITNLRPGQSPSR
ncbi:hypothetical protein [Actinophytocola sediminis]